jgi:hypothetical protein
VDAETEFELLCNHLASLLGVDDIDAPLRRSLTLYTQSVIAREHARPSQHPTPIVDVCDRVVTASPTTGGQSGDNRPSEYARPTLPTDPPGVDYSDPPVTGRTSKGFPRARLK